MSWMIHKKFRTFDGEKYTFTSSYTDKDWAEEKASRLRSYGNKVRIVQRVTDSRTFWDVFSKNA